MGRKKPPETVTVDGFTWVQLCKGGEELAGSSGSTSKERWELTGYSGICIRICDFGPGDDKYRSGWRVMSGGPEKERWETQEEAMENARKTIVSEMKNKLEMAHVELNRVRKMAEEIGGVLP